MPRFLLRSRGGCLFGEKRRGGRGDCLEKSAPLNSKLLPPPYQVLSVCTERVLLVSVPLWAMYHLGLNPDFRQLTSLAACRLFLSE